MNEERGLWPFITRFGNIPAFPGCPCDLLEIRCQSEVVGEGASKRHIIGLLRAGRDFVGVCQTRGDGVNMMYCIVVRPSWQTGYATLLIAPNTLS